MVKDSIDKTTPKEELVKIEKMLLHNLAKLKKDINMYTKGQVDAITYYYLKNSGEVVTPIVNTNDNKLVAFAMSIQKAASDSIRYINYI